MIYRGIVQLVERWSPKPNVEGSSPSAPVLEIVFGLSFFIYFIYNPQLSTIIISNDVIKFSLEYLSIRQRDCCYVSLSHFATASYFILSLHSPQ